MAHRRGLAPRAPGGPVGRPAQQEPSPPRGRAARLRSLGAPWAPRALAAVAVVDRGQDRGEGAACGSREGGLPHPES
eukprot:5014008-Alexandrium_andersonii.AAC.1